MAGRRSSSIPAIVLAATFYREETAGSSLTSATAIGNLIHPLSYLQVLGIWPAGDFRIRAGRAQSGHRLRADGRALPDGRRSACGGRGGGGRGRSCSMPARCGRLPRAHPEGLAVGRRQGARDRFPGDPARRDGAAAGAIFERGRRVEAAVLVLAIGGGVMWSNVLAYHGVWLAPRAQLAELATIGDRFAGDGPTLMTEYQPYGARHFLRRMDPEGTSELRTRVDPLLDGQPLGKGEYADLDQFQLDGVEAYRWLVLRRSPTESRPPSNYRRAWTGHYYEVWRQVGTASSIVKHLALGNASQPGGVARCSTVMQMARGPSALLAVPRSPVIYVDLAAALHPPTWTADGVGAVTADRGGTVETNIRRPAPAGTACGSRGRSATASPLRSTAAVAAGARDMLNNSGQ